MSTSGDQMTMHEPAGFADFIAATSRQIATAAGRFGVSMSRTYATDVEDLWSAWTDPERMARWIGRPFGDLREGGAVRLVMAGPDSSEPTAGSVDDCANITILHCDAPTRLTVKWAYGREDPSLVDLTLTAVDASHTLLRLDHKVLVEDESVSYGAGWEGFLARLDAAVAGTDPQFESIEPQLKPIWVAAVATARPLGLPSITPTGVTTRLDAERWVAADTAAVWACLATADGLRRWYVNEVTGTLSPGGSFRCVFDQGAATGEVLACDAEREVSVSWRWDGNETTSRMTVTLTSDTRDGVLGTHVAWREDDATGNVAAYGAGLHAHLVGLDRAARGLPSTGTRWGADFVIALSELEGRYTDPLGG